MFTIIDTVKDIPIKCDKYIEVPMRFEGTGGLFSGGKWIETSKENMDEMVKTCIAGEGLFGYVNLEKKSK